MPRVLGDDPLARRRKDARAAAHQDVFFARAESSETIQQELHPIESQQAHGESQGGASSVAITVQAEPVPPSQVSGGPSSSSASAEATPPAKEEPASQRGGFLGRFFGRLRK